MKAHVKEEGTHNSNVPKMVKPVILTMETGIELLHELYKKSSGKTQVKTNLRDNYIDLTLTDQMVQSEQHGNRALMLHTVKSIEIGKLVKAGAMAFPHPKYVEAKGKSILELGAILGEIIHPEAQSGLANMMRRILSESKNDSEWRTAVMKELPQLFMAHKLVSGVYFAQLFTMFEILTYA